MGVPITQSIYPVDTVFPGTSNMGSQLGTPPGLAVTGTGWVVSKVAAGNFREMVYGSELAAASGAAAQPSGDLSGADAVVGGPFEGSFQSGNWNVSIAWRAVSGGGDQDGLMTFRVWKGTNPTGTNAILLTPTQPISGSIVTNLTTTSPQTSTASVVMPEVRVDHEYIFLEIGWLITGAGGANGRDVNMYVGTSSFIKTTPLIEHPPTGVIWSHDEYPAP